MKARVVELCPRAAKPLAQVSDARSQPHRVCPFANHSLRQFDHPTKCLEANGGAAFIAHFGTRKTQSNFDPTGSNDCSWSSTFMEN
jgi:hypothetical protein